MKVLDVDLFQDGIQRNIAMLDRLRSETDTIYQAVLGLVEMEEQLKGAGGNAIRSFYRECHMPFLQFFRMFSQSFKKVLEQMEAALHSFEPDSAGYILERFLEGELEEGLMQISQLTASLTDETNSITDRVSDIVSLPHLDDSGVQEGVIQSKKKRTDTVTGLNVFDASQTFALNFIEQDLQAMDMWLADMEGLFKAGVKDITFVQSQWDVLTLRSHIRTELFPKVYLNPGVLWVEKQEQLIGTMITAATFQSLEGKKVNTVEEHVEENVKYHQYENGLLIKEYIVGQTVFYEVVSKVEYKQEIVQTEIPKENVGLDIFQTVLDVAGLIPGVGEIADGLNGVIYSFRGDKTNAALSFGAMIPFVGWASTGGKFAKKGNDLYQARNVVNTEKMASVYSPIYQDVVNSPLGKTQNHLNILSNTRYQLGMPDAFTFNMPPVKTEIPTTIKSGDVKTDTINVDVGAKGIGKSTPVGNVRLKSTKLSSEKIELDWLPDQYTPIEVNGSVKVAGKEVDVSRRVYQIEIDKTYLPKDASAGGLTNMELMAKGKSPYVVKNGVDSKVELHHLIQKEPGGMVEIAESTHDKYSTTLHGLVEDGNSFRNNPELEKQYNNFRNNYWKMRANEQ
ncbi:T7SS effector LXG polymorphic toxin [Psychrobacillus sp. NPDC096426]|uniref:T7SS effector LXG polymorphic toxin n=1 Tax=Psychrobacillus sp. NPDC096426 TaxID=3364491 RepID=UPI0037F582B4